MSKVFEKVSYGSSRHWYLFGKEIGRAVDKCYYLFNDRYVGWHDWKFGIYYEECGYDEPNGELHISLLGWHSVFKMPWKSKRFPYGDCDAPTWGIEIHDNTLWIMKGGNGNMNGGNKWWTWDLPWWTWEHVRHDVFCDIGNDDEVDFRMIPYETLCGKSYKPLDENKLVYKYYYDYTDTYDGTVIPCVFWVEEREWRRKWFTKCKWPVTRNIHRYIEIEFKDEVGSRKGTWKGGVMGCSYTLNPGETPMDCIKRMEKEKQF